MAPKPTRRTHVFAGMLLLLVVAGESSAQTCDIRSPHVQFARDNLQRAAQEGDLSSAQDYADRARREFNQLAAWSARCGCPPAAAKFDEAASQIRHAQEAESRRAIRDTIDMTRPLLDEALTRLQDCRKR